MINKDDRLEDMETYSTEIKIVDQFRIGEEMK